MILFSKIQTSKYPNKSYSSLRLKYLLSLGMAKKFTNRYDDDNLLQHVHYGRQTLQKKKKTTLKLVLTNEASVLIMQFNGRPSCIRKKELNR